MMVGQPPAVGERDQSAVTSQEPPAGPAAAGTDRSGGAHRIEANVL
jgi:hypothetical protein